MKATALARFHVIVFIWGFTAILGKLISLEALELVWYRLIFTIVSLYIFFRFHRFNLQLALPSAAYLLFIGLIVGAHWYFFYHAIKVSNVSITLISLSTITLFTSLLEPLFFRRKVSIYEILLALVVIAGIAMIYRFEMTESDGMLYGILAAFCGSLFVVLNGKVTHHHHSYAITFYEMAGALVLLTTMGFVQGGVNFSFNLSWADTFYLLLLSIICTAYPFVVSVKLMKELSPFTVNMITNLEPVYGIVLSLLIFGDTEYMSSGFYAGTFLILCAIFAYIYLKKRNRL